MEMLLLFEKGGLAFFIYYLKCCFYKKKIQVAFIAFFF